MPKAELHLHLEGSLRPATLARLNPALSAADAAARLAFTDFLGFLKAFVFVDSQLQRPEHYALALDALAAELAAQNVTYAEVILSAGVVAWKGLALDEVFDALAEAAARQPLRIRFILDAVRQWGELAAWPLVEFAAARQHQGVVAFGIGGDESRGPAPWFARVFAYARQRGLRLTPHSGESAGPESVWAALELGADRIGHGVRSIEDPALVAHLARHQIPLEISLTSNIRTGVYGSFDQHPARALFDAGVPLILNTDDPALFDVTLTSEYELARSLGFSDPELSALAENSFRFALDA